MEKVSTSSLPSGVKYSPKVLDAALAALTTSLSGLWVAMNPPPASRGRHSTNRCCVMAGTNSMPALPPSIFSVGGVEERPRLGARHLTGDLRAVALEHGDERHQAVSLTAVLAPAANILAVVVHLQRLLLRTSLERLTGRCTARLLA